MIENIPTVLFFYMFHTLLPHALTFFHLSLHHFFTATPSTIAPPLPFSSLT